jgi:hypothetical protein
MEREFPTITAPDELPFIEIGYFRENARFHRKKHVEKRVQLFGKYQRIYGKNLFNILNLKKKFHLMNQSL